jgi:hypothetical protein
MDDEEKRNAAIGRSRFARKKRTTVVGARQPEDRSSPPADGGDATVSRQGMGTASSTVERQRLGLHHGQLGRPQAKAGKAVGVHLLERCAGDDQHQRPGRSRGPRARDPRGGASIETARPDTSPRMRVPVTEVGGHPARSAVDLGDLRRLPRRVRHESVASVFGLGAWSSLREHLYGERVLVVDESEQDATRLERRGAPRLAAKLSDHGGRDPHPRPPHDDRAAQVSQRGCGSSACVLHLGGANGSSSNEQTKTSPRSISVASLPASAAVATRAA